MTSSKIFRLPRSRDLYTTDAKGNTILHQLAQDSTTRDIPLDIVAKIVEANPDLLTIPNQIGLIPAQILENIQLHLQSANRPLRRLLTNGLPESPIKEGLRKMTEITLTEHLPASQNEGLDFRILSSSSAQTLLKQPTLLFFSGRGTFDPPLITGFMRKIRASLNIMDVPFKKAQLLCARYPGHMVDLIADWQLMHQSPAKQISPDHPNLYVRPFVHRYIRPLYLTADNKRLPLRQAMKNMRLLTLYGYSYGTSVIQMIADELNTDMQAHGYSTPETVLIQSQILTFQMGSDLNPEHYQNNFRQYHLLNTMDEIVFERVRPLLPEITPQTPNLVQTHLKEAPNQTVLMVNTTYLNNDDSPHHTNTYCNEGTEVQKRVKLWKNSIIFNGLNNSVQNAQGKTFIPLPKIIDTPPKRLLFTQKQDPLRILITRQKTICRQQKIVIQDIKSQHTRSG